MTRRGVRRLTIRRQLAALTLVVALPLVGALAYAARSAREDAGVAAKRSSSQMAGLAASSVQEFIAAQRAQLAVIAGRPLVGRMNPAYCDPILRESYRLNRYAANVTTESLDGQVICSALPAPRGGLPNVMAFAWFRRVRRSGLFTVGEPFLGPISHKYVAVLVLPLEDRGYRTGYVSTAVDLVGFQTMFAQLAAPSRALVTVVTRSGLIVARSVDAGRFVGTRLPAPAIAQLRDPPSVVAGPDGVTRIYARAAVPGTSWIVSAGMPTAVVYAASDRLLRTLLIVAAALLALALLAAILIGRWIAGPIQVLARRARDIAEGRSPAATALRGSDEVVLAAGRLDEMVAALGESDKRLGHALDAAGMGAWELDLTSGRSWRSLRHDQIFGHAEPVADWSLESALAHIVPADHPLFHDRLAQALETGRWEVECRVTWPDGSEHWIRIDGRVEYGEDRKPLRIAGTVADVSERVRNDEAREHLVEQLRQSQKMEAVGQLAGGIAHDFNNLLTAICGYSELALSRLDGSDRELLSDIEEIAQAGERAAQLTRQLLAFSRRQTLQPVVFDLNDAVSASETLLRRLLGEHVDILSSLTPEGCAINADRGQIEQVLINLAVNARDAMPGGGTLALETERIRLAAGPAERRFQAPAGEYVLLRVSDTGCGMDDVTRARAFEPFFTTKPLGEGTGLGLATVFGIVSQNAGFIALTSEAGAGATFEILLPLTTAAIATPACSPAPRTHVRGERILLVEDEPVVRDLTRRILAAEGYDVTAAADGEEALRLSRDHPFDLLLTDIVMPKLGGKELAHRLHHTQPGLPVIYMSGYAHDTAGERLNPNDTFIQKPFSTHDLGTTVRAKLDSTRAQALIT